MVAAHLQEKNGVYYVVINYKTATGQRKTKWQSTKLPVKGNKKRAEAMMNEIRKEFQPPADSKGPASPDMLFADYLLKWLEIAKGTVQLTTYSSYKNLSEGEIIPYFRKLQIKLCELKACHIQEFYMMELKRVKPNTVIHYHAIIHRALKYAVKTDLLDANPADKVDRPKKNTFVASFYDKDEMNALFEAVKGSKIEVPVMLTAFYGLRRSEVVGLKWDAINFEENTLEIRHTVCTVKVDGKRVLLKSDTTKTKSSKRTLPLIPMFRERLLALKAEQEENRKLCGRCYNKEFEGYICVDAMGNLILPNSLSDAFKNTLVNHNLRVIRFHDLRHSCASLLLANGVPMKQIQEWLGHSDFATTANIYSHLDFSSKVTSAEAMMSGLGIASN
ncbi:tyrosine-type recombinase/integrase [Gemmiger sp.]